MTSRPIWLHSALSALPFALMAIAGVIRERVPRGLALPYLGLVVVLSVPLLLLATGMASEGSMLGPIIEMFRPSFDR